MSDRGGSLGGPGYQASGQHIVHVSGDEVSVPWAAGEERLWSMISDMRFVPELVSYVPGFKEAKFGGLAVAAVLALLSETYRLASRTEHGPATHSRNQGPFVRRCVASGPSWKTVQICHGALLGRCRSSENLSKFPCLAILLDSLSIKK